MITASSGVPVPRWIANGEAAQSRTVLGLFEKMKNTLQGKQLVVVEQETAGRAGMVGPWYAWAPFNDRGFP